MSGKNPYSTNQPTDKAKGSKKSAFNGETFEVLDIQSIDVSDPLKAIKRFDQASSARIVRCDVLIVGGGTGGLAAALSLLHESGKEDDRRIKVCLTEETDWLGGQMTSQGVSALDENYLVETSGAAADYQLLRSLIRGHYAEMLPKNPSPEQLDKIGRIDRLNPGSCWVSRLSFEPRVALAAIDEMLEPLKADKGLSLYMRHKCVKVITADREGKKKIRSITTVHLESGELVEFHPRFVLDATELGDLLPLAGLSYSSGAESTLETKELHAEDNADPENVQDFVYPFVVDLRPGEQHTIKEPCFYREFEKDGRFSLLGYKMFESARDDQKELLPFWTYRRLIDRELFSSAHYPFDISMINWESNDLRDENIIDVQLETQAKRLAKGKALSLGFLYWLQTELQRDDGGRGYKELRLLYDVLGSDDGLSKYPYIRESRRIVPLHLVTEEEISARTNDGARAKLFSDSVGIGLYPIDIHGRKKPGAAQETKPFQIPMSSLIPRDAINLLAACKNIGVTHITNGAYRLHPIEWAIGSACGIIARRSLLSRKSPQLICRNRDSVIQIQTSLAYHGSPMFWFDDVPTDHDQFMEIQMIAVAGLWTVDSSSLSFQPAIAVTKREALECLEKLLTGRNSKQTSDTPPDTVSSDAQLLSFEKSKHLRLTDKAEGLNETVSRADMQRLAKHSLLKISKRKRLLVSVLEDIGEGDVATTRAEFAQWLYHVADYKKRL